MRECGVTERRSVRFGGVWVLQCNGVAVSGIAGGTVVWCGGMAYGFWLRGECGLVRGVG